MPTRSKRSVYDHLRLMRPWICDYGSTICAVLAALVMLWVLCSTAAADSSVLTARQDSILRAIQMVEVGTLDPDVAATAVGDSGRAIGPFQIHLSYYQDASCQNRQLASCYSRCRDARFARGVVEAYMLRYCPDAWRCGDAETIARTHNGGPKGPQRASTLTYWRKVKAQLDKQR